MNPLHFLVKAATATSDAKIVRIGKIAMIRLLQSEPSFSKLFMKYLLVDQLFNSSEKRLARELLLMAYFGKEGKPEANIAKVTQKTLAEIIGTTRSRVSFFLNSSASWASYNGRMQPRSLLSVVIHD